MHASIPRMPGVKDATRVRGVPNTALKAKLIWPVGDYWPVRKVRHFLVRTPARADALSVSRELPKPVQSTPPVCKHAPLNELHSALPAWAGSF